MAQFNISLIPESMRQGVKPIVDELDAHDGRIGGLERHKVASTKALELLRVDIKALQKYQPVLDQLADVGLTSSVAALEEAIDRFSQSPQFEAIMTEIIAEALKASVAEVGEMLQEVQGKIGVVQLDQTALISRVDRLVGRVDAHDARLDGHDKDILGLKATSEGLATQVAVLQKGGVGESFSMKTWAIVSMLLIAAGLFLAWLTSGNNDNFNAGRTYMVIAVAAVIVAALVASLGDAKSTDSDSKPVFRDKLADKISTNKPSATTTAPPSPAPVVTNSTEPATQPAAVAAASTN